MYERDVMANDYQKRAEIKEAFQRAAGKRENYGLLGADSSMFEEKIKCPTNRVEGFLTVAEMTLMIDKNINELHMAISNLEDRMYPVLAPVACEDTGRPVAPIPARSDLVQNLITLNEKIGNATYRVQMLIDRTEL